MISLVERNARKTPGMSAKAAPPAAPATTIAAIESGAQVLPSAIAAAAPTIAPT